MTRRMQGTKRLVNSRCRFPWRNSARSAQVFLRATCCATMSKPQQISIWEGSGGVASEPRRILVRKKTWTCLTSVPFCRTPPTVHNHVPLPPRNMELVFFILLFLGNVILGGFLVFMKYVRSLKYDGKSTTGAV